MSVRRGRTAYAAWRLAVLGCILVPFYQEFVQHVVFSWSWNPMQDIQSPGDQVRVLFVADPQLPGIEKEPNPWGLFSRWDADRFLHKTFILAVSRFQPDVIVYLGDLFDEGSKAQEPLFQEYVQRFKDIFRTEEHVKHIYLSGDNDIGGEEFDFRTVEKTNKFDKYFHDQGVVPHKFVDFMRLHYDFMMEIWNIDREVHNVSQQATSNFRVLLNHMVVLNRIKPNVVPIMKILKPSIIISAHTHKKKRKGLITTMEAKMQLDSKATHHTCLDCWELDDPSINSGPIIRVPIRPWTLASRIMTGNDILHLVLNDGVSLHEIAVPTSSYRNGEEHMGYGAAVFSSGGYIDYCVYWLPSRYQQFNCYYYTVLVLIVLILLYWCRRWLRLIPTFRIQVVR